MSATWGDRPAVQELYDTLVGVTTVCRPSSGDEYVLVTPAPIQVGTEVHLTR
jgi:hypothetical protein